MYGPLFRETMGNGASWKEQEAMRNEHTQNNFSAHRPDFAAGAGGRLFWRTERHGSGLSVCRGNEFLQLLLLRQAGSEDVQRTTGDARGIAARVSGGGADDAAH